MTCPSDPTASWATCTQARSTMGVVPVRAAWPAGQELVLPCSKATMHAGISLPNMPLGPSTSLTAGRARREMLAVLRVARPAVPRPVARPPNTLGVSPSLPIGLVARPRVRCRFRRRVCSQSVAEQQQQPGSPGAASGLHDGDALMAFLDDLYIVTAPNRAPRRRRTSCVQRGCRRTCE